MENVEAPQNGQVEESINGIVHEGPTGVTSKVDSFLHRSMSILNWTNSNLN